MGRGELGFLLASQALEKELITDLAFSVSMWALFLSTILSPFPFGYLLKKKRQREAQDLEEEEEEEKGQESVNYQTFS